MQQNTVGLGVLLVDLLVATPGYLHEDRLAEALRLSTKNVRKVGRGRLGEGVAWCLGRAWVQPPLQQERP